MLVLQVYHALLSVYYIAMGDMAFIFPLCSAKPYPFAKSERQPHGCLFLSLPPGIDCKIPRKTPHNPHNCQRCPRDSIRHGFPGAFCCYLAIFVCCFLFQTVSPVSGGAAHRDYILILWRSMRLGSKWKHRPYSINLKGRGFWFFPGVVGQT